MEENTIMEETKIVIRAPNFPKDVDENLQREPEFMIKSNESLAENKR